MKLNNIASVFGSKSHKNRLGRGIGSGSGKTSSRGHKGQKARAGGYHKIGFEGGQTPIQRRLPKFGFTSLNSKIIKEVKLNSLLKIKDKVIDLQVLKKHGLICNKTKYARLIFNKNFTSIVHINGIYCTESVKHVIKSLGGIID